MTPVWRIVVFLAALGTAWSALRPGDPHAAAQAWSAARAVHGTTLDARLDLGVAAFQRDVAPWQTGHTEARRRLSAISAARRAALPDDRGALREPVRPTR